MDDRVPVEVMKTKVPGVRWDRLQGSGVLVSDQSERQLDRLWDDYVNASVFRSQLRSRLGLRVTLRGFGSYSSCFAWAINS
jgi:hypothetical protein